LQPARPTPNFFNAARRVTDWAMLFVSSSNLRFIFLFYGFVLLFVSLWPEMTALSLGALLIG
jgi:hypothetical protein